MKKFVYLAGPIEGCSNHEINQWRQKCYTGFNDFIVGVNPYRAEREADDPEARKRIVMKNYMDTKSCDLVFAYLSLLGILLLQKKLFRLYIFS